MYSFKTKKSENFKEPKFSKIQYYLLGNALYKSFLSFEKFFWKTPYGMLQFLYFNPTFPKKSEP